MWNKQNKQTKTWRNKKNLEKTITLIKLLRNDAFSDKKQTNKSLENISTKKRRRSIKSKSNITKRNNILLKVETEIKKAEKK